MREAYICCEGPICNGGVSAEQREAAYVPRGATLDMRAELQREARGHVSRALAVTPHVRISGVTRHGHTRYACTVCGHERIYGSLAWAWEDSPYVDAMGLATGGR